MKKGEEILVYPEQLITPPRPSPTIKGASKQKCEIIFKEIELRWGTREQPGSVSARGPSRSGILGSPGVLAQGRALYLLAVEQGFPSVCVHRNDLEGC